jgi:hypothetical protein
MKVLAFLAITFFAAAALAQDKPAAPKEAAKPEPVKEAAAPAPAPSKAGPRKQRRWNEDARHCLERTSNTEVIKCAEEFL